MKSSKYLTFALVLPVCAVIVSCSDKPESQKEGSSWDQLKSDAHDTYSDALEMSIEKWNQLKSFSSEEWEESAKSIVALKDKVVEAGDEVQPKVEKLLKEAEELRESAEKQMKEFKSATGDKVDTSKEKLEKTWEQLQEKLAAAKSAIEEH